MNSFISEFGLTFKQTCLLFSLERKIVLDDITYSKVRNKIEDANKKQEWLNQWEAQINNFLNGFVEKQSAALIDITTIDSQSLYKEILESEEECSIKAWKHLVLLECTLFTPYYILDMSEEEKKNFFEKFTDKFKGNVSLNEDTQKLCLGRIAVLLDISPEYITKFKEGYSKSLKKLSGFWTNVLIGMGTGIVVFAGLALFFANPIAGLIVAGKGLAGAAAFSAGMAALGGGAIAAGGFGIVGGIAVLVGGAAVLGGASGGGIGALASKNPQFVLTESAKMQVVLKEIILGVQKDTKLFQEILLRLQSNILQMENEVEELKKENEKNKEKIKNLEEAIHYMKKAFNEL